MKRKQTSPNWPLIAWNNFWLILFAASIIVNCFLFFSYTPTGRKLGINIGKQFNELYQSLSTWRWFNTGNKSNLESKPFTDISSFKLSSFTPTPTPTPNFILPNNLITQAPQPNTSLVQSTQPTNTIAPINNTSITVVPVTPIIDNLTQTILNTIPVERPVPGPSVLPKIKSITKKSSELNNQSINHSSDLRVDPRLSIPSTNINKGIQSPPLRVGPQLPIIKK